MKNTLLAAFAGLCLLATSASAATYYVWAGHPNSNDSHLGTSITAPKKTLTSLKATARPADVIRLYSGSYTWTAFDSAGSNPAGNGYITIIGTHSLADPLTDGVAREAISINNLVVPIGQSYISVKGIKFSTAVVFGAASNHDSLRACTVQGNLEIAGGDYNVISECEFRGPRVLIGRSGSFAPVVGNKIISNHFDRLGLNAGVGETEHFWIQGTCGADARRVDSTTVWFNHVEFKGGAAVTTAKSGPTLMCTKNQKFRGNRWYYHAEATDDYLFRLSDSTSACAFDVDTVLASGSGGGTMILSSAGQFTSPNVYGNSWDSMYVNVSGANVGISFLDGMVDCSITKSVWVARRTALLADIVRGANTITRNTLASLPPVVDFRRRPGTPAWADTNVALLNNILYGGPGATAPPPYEDGYSHACAIYYESAAFDSATKMKGQVGLEAHHNLYAYFGKAYTDGDRSLLIKNGPAVIVSTPGDSTATNPAGRVDNRWTLDSLSVYGSPRFDRGGPDSVLGINFDPRIGERSRARGTGVGGIDIGAIAYVSMGQIVVQPTYLLFDVDVPSSRPFVIYNTGTGTLEVTSITVPAGRYSVSPSTASIAAGASATVTVSYSAGAPGPSNSVEITVRSDDPADPIVVVTAAAVGDGGAEP